MNMTEQNQNNLPPNSHPENNGTIPVEAMEDQLGANFYELDRNLDSLGLAEEERMDELAQNTLRESYMSGIDDDIWNLAGYDRKLANAQSVEIPEMRKPPSYTGVIAERAKTMTEGERQRLRQQAARYVHLKMDLE